jgi:hypothetical protein
MDAGELLEGGRCDYIPRVNARYRLQGARVPQGPTRTNMVRYPGIDFDHQMAVSWRAESVCTEFLIHLYMFIFRFC